MKKVLYILGEFEDSDIEWILTAGKRQRVPAGGVLIREGEPVGAMSIILEGRFSVTARGLGGKEVARLGAGEIVGEMSSVDSRPPSATVTALEDSLVLSLADADIAAKLGRDVGFAARFYRALAVFLSDRLRGTMSRLGYGESDTLQEDVEYEDELDMDVLDNISMAGARFERILRQLKGDR
ncbi:MAG: cyclic nucleotide-binding domain-containing protein [Pseudomonadota bacterium]